VTARPDQLHPDDALQGLSTITTGKWTIIVVLRLGGGTLRFSQLRRELAISQKTLTVTLRGLERDGFVSRTSYATIPPRVEYALTELGNEALGVFEAWEAFARKHWAVVAAARQRFDGAAGGGRPGSPDIPRLRR
jgi:DNA-binding HxlR family transcriptional regulator